MGFEWDNAKDAANMAKHGLSFQTAQAAFLDAKRVIMLDVKHSSAAEKRYFCIGQTDAGIVTVRFTQRGSNIRIIGAGYWRKGKKLYEREVH